MKRVKRNSTFIVVWALYSMLLSCQGTVNNDLNGDNTVDIDSHAEDIDSEINTEPVTLHVFDEVLFYDGYAEIVDEPVPKGIIRLRNSLYTRKLSSDELQLIQNTLTMEVLVKAACDNYDRIGNVNLAIVPKGSDTYDPKEVARIELGRYITPFMNKNKQPDTVPYSWKINNVLPILKDKDLGEQYDFWVELELFGVPYSANKEVAGCAGRNDVFYGSLFFHSDYTQDAQNFNILIPLAIKERFNNYEEGASEELYVTKKTVDFTLETAVKSAQFVLITSNHGANNGGEEYKRREHLVYVDDELMLTYTPGRESCEPFRKYNTQGNGIYGFSEKSDEDWQSFSNWCPGDVIDTRIIELGSMDAGKHTFIIDVPKAIFANGQGNFPFSLYFQGREL